MSQSGTRFWFKVNSVFEAFRPVYRASKMVGILVDTIDFRKHDITRTVWDQIALVAGVLLDLQALKLAAGRSLSISDSILLNVGIYSSVNLGFIISLCIPLCNRIFARRMHGMIKTMAEVDGKLEDHGYHLKHQLNHFLSCAYMATPILINFLLFGSTLIGQRVSEAQRTSLLEIIIFIRSSLVYTIFGSYSCLTLTSIYMRCKGLNAVVCSFHSQRLSSPIDTRSLIASVRCFGELHEKLCDIILSFNYCFGLQLLCMMASAFGFTLFSLFGLVHDLSRSTGDENYIATMYNMVYGCIYLSFIIQVVVNGSLVTHECKKTAVMIHKTICYNHLEPAVMRQIKFFSLQLFNSDPQVSCLLYNFQWSFLVSVLSSLMMHIVILVQFDLANIATKV
ncbi:uncharacterized protein LOC131211466 [Anopheles bellator]|uniref:uncharacterized protein LOC131211466 n=1 Tax=Anopheles bellator TaxID=139047 RepID=UPI0026479A14|nr:uncharacterized protein LOC131211466 [Anopheles bellator]